ncbi:hypothetical protein FACS189413_10940 [Bacteroidia bacterium]|nr:hypothetical protein FACS189413_10940 [Bacteroidia bacterium]
MKAQTVSVSVYVEYKKATPTEADAFAFPAIPNASDAMIAAWGGGGRGARTTRNLTECYAGGGGGGGFVMYKAGPNGIGWPIQKYVSWVVVGEGGGVVDKYWADGGASSFGNDYFGRIRARGGIHGTDDSTVGGAAGQGTYSNGNDATGYTISSVLENYPSNLIMRTGGKGGNGNNRNEKSGNGGTSAGLYASSNPWGYTPFDAVFSAVDGQAGGAYVSKNQYNSANYEWIGNGGQGSGSPGSTHYAGNGDQPGGGGGASAHDHLLTSTDHKNGANGWVIVKFNYNLPEAQDLLSASVAENICGTTTLSIINSDMWENVEWYKVGTSSPVSTTASYTVPAGTSGSYYVTAERRAMAFEFEGATSLSVSGYSPQIFEITTTEYDKNNNGKHYRITGRKLTVKKSGTTYNSRIINVISSASITPVLKPKNTVIDAATATIVTDLKSDTIFVTTKSRAFDLSKCLTDAYLGSLGANNLVVYYWKDGEAAFTSTQKDRNIAGDIELYHTGAIKTTSGCNSDIRHIVVSFIGSDISIWAPGIGGAGGDLTSWTEAKNWVKGAVPHRKSIVYIPGFLPKSNNLNTVVKTFPKLTSGDNAKCHEIYFTQGGEITNLQYLTYDSAHVQLNLGLANQTELPDISAVISGGEYDHLDLSAALGLDSRYKNVIERDRWYMLSAPLKQIVSGDYSFGGVPATYIRKFKSGSATTTSALQGSWDNYIQSTVEPLSPGEGFAFFVNPKQDENSYRESEYLFTPDDHLIKKNVGLQEINGILEFPYFDAETNLAGAAQQKAHRSHLYRPAEKKSYFFDYLSDDLDLVWDGSPKSIVRTNDAYKLNTTNVNYSVTASQGVDGNRMAMVGNPYMSTIDFVKFQTANTTALKDSYYIFKSEFNTVTDSWVSYFATYGNLAGYTGVVLGGDQTDVNQYIAPMQSFIVEMKTNSSNLAFNIADISTPRPQDVSASLRSDEEVFNKLSITAHNQYGTVLASVLRIEEGQSEISDWDVTKILAGMHNLPEVYTLKSNGEGASRGIAANFIGKEAVLIPIGLATGYTGKITLGLEGMDAFDGHILFIDTERDFETEVTGQSKFEYEFDYTPAWANSIVPEMEASENRFFLRVSAGTTGIDEWEDSNAGVQAYLTASSVRFNAYDAIQSINIYDVQGRLVYQNAGLNKLSYDVNKQLIPTIAIAQVTTEKGSYTIKLINK